MAFNIQLNWAPGELLRGLLCHPLPLEPDLRGQLALQDTCHHLRRLTGEVLRRQGTEHLVFLFG